MVRMQPSITSGARAKGGESEKQHHGSAQTACNLMNLRKLDPQSTSTNLRVRMHSGRGRCGALRRGRELSSWRPPRRGKQRHTNFSDLNRPHDRYERAPTRGRPKVPGSRGF